MISLVYVATHRESVTAVIHAAHRFDTVCFSPGSPIKGDFI